LDLITTLGSLAAILILGLLAGKMFPVKIMLNDERVRRNMARYAPEAIVSEVLVGNDGRSAIVLLTAPDQCFGLVRQMGDRIVCRLVSAAEAVAVLPEHAKLTLVFDDFTQPEVKLLLDGDAQARALAAVKTVTSKSEALDAA